MLLCLEQIKAAKLIVYILIFIFISTDLSFAMDKEYRILFVASYHPSFPTFFPQIEGVRTGLSEEGLQKNDVILDIEFMDTKRFNPESAIPRFDAMLSGKLKGLPPYDIVIAADDNATRYLATNRARLFGAAPLVFLGVNNHTLALAQNDDPKVTGVLEAVSIGKTLDVMKQIAPPRTSFVVICDATPSGQGDLAIFRRAIAARPWVHYRLLSLMEMDFEGLMGDLRSVDKMETILLISALRDNDGNSKDFRDSLREIYSTTKAPILHLWEHGLGDGVLGGVIVSHQEQGRAAGGVAGRILKGADPATIPVVETSPNIPVFDYDELVRFTINPHLLPDNAVVLNNPEREGFIISKEHLIPLMLVVFMIVLVGIGAVIYMVRLNAMKRDLVAANLEAVKANQAKSNFLAAMSHELRTPLNAVLGFAQMMDLRVFGPLGHKRYEEYAKDIIESGQYLLSLINDLLDMAKIESGKKDLLIESVPLCAEVKAVIHLLEENAARQQVSLVSTVSDDVPSLFCDRRALHQMLFNLLSNGIKFTPSGGRVTVAANRSPDGGVIIDVIDTGVGIAPEDQQTVLEPFVQSTSAMKTREAGTGLGLSLVKSLIELHEGRLTLVSRLGHGTTVSLRFPAKAVRAVDQKTATPQRPHRRDEG